MYFTESNVNYQLLIKELLDKKDYEKINELMVGSIQSSYEHLKSLRELEKENTLLHFITNPVQDDNFGEYSIFQLSNDDLKTLEEKLQEKMNND